MNQIHPGRKIKFMFLVFDTPTILYPTKAIGIKTNKYTIKIGCNL